MALMVANGLGAALGRGLLHQASDVEVHEVSEEAPWAAGDAEVLLARPSPAWRAARDLPAPRGWPGRLRWAFSASTGMEGYPDWLFQVPLVTCGRGLAAEAVADFVIAALYRQAMNLDDVCVDTPEAWRQGATLTGIEGASIGILGLGAIGSAVARRTVALGMRVQALRRSAAGSPVDGVYLTDDVSSLFAASDHVVVALPDTQATRLMINGPVLRHARRGAHLINVGRGVVIDHDALVGALDAGAPGFATLDVTHPEPLPEGHPLWGHPRVRITPHVAARRVNSERLLVERVLSELDRYRCGQRPANLIDRGAAY